MPVKPPCGMKFTTLAGVMGGGASSPGFVGHSKFNVTQRKFIKGDGGLLRMVWMPKSLKEEIRERLIKRGEELGYPGLVDMIADETVGTTEVEILPFSAGKRPSGIEHASVGRLISNKSLNGDRLNMPVPVHYHIRIRRTKWH